MEPLLSLCSERVTTSGVECKGDCLKDYKMTLRFLCCSALFIFLFLFSSPFTELVSGEARFTPSAVSPPAERCDRNCCSVSAPRYLQVHLLWCRSLHYFQFSLHAIFIQVEVSHTPLDWVLCYNTESQ